MPRENILTIIELEAVSWNEIYEMLLSLADKIKQDKFEPDILVGVCRGGWIPACIFSDLLQKTQLASVKVEFYTGIAKAKREPMITQPVSAPVDGKKVLVIDDIVDTGKSIDVVKWHIRELKAKEVKIATLYRKPWSKTVPDYYEKETDKWIIFPWEIKETVISLTKEYLENGKSIEEAKRKLIETGIDRKYIEKFTEEIMKDLGV